jgi:hypothetical protein
MVNKKLSVPRNNTTASARFGDHIGAEDVIDPAHQWSVLDEHPCPSADALAETRQREAL